MDADTFRQRYELMSSPEVTSLVRRANDQYAHWHRFRNWEFPSGVDPILAWAALDISRHVQFTALPISFYSLEEKLKYWNPSRHLEWLHRIDHKAGGTLGGTVGESLGDDDRYLFNSLMEEAIASSQLEGASTTRHVAKKMLREKRRPRSKEELMIFNNYRAIREIRELKDERLTPKLLCHIQSILTEGTLEDERYEGRFRIGTDDIVVEDRATHELMHRPPTADSIDLRIQELCNFANQRDDSFVHPVVKAIILHFAVGFIHPFVDGNGRTARAVFYWWMLRNDYWLFEYLPISRIFIESPRKYSMAYLNTETDRGDVTYFIHYNLSVILQALDDLHQYLKRKQLDYSEASKLLSSFPNLNPRQISVIRDAIKSPHAVYTIQHHCGAFAVSYATARKDLLELGEAGLLVQHDTSKQFAFTPSRDLAEKIKKGCKTSQNRSVRKPKRRSKG